MADDEIVLHYSVASRSITALWMLEELGVPYRLVERGLRSAAIRAPEYLKLNPMGQVPTLEIGPVVVSENPAICAYLADRYSYGDLAPRIEDPERGAWLKWLVFTTAVLEPAVALARASVDFGPAGEPPWGITWGHCDEVVRALTQALEGRDYIVGSRFTAADVMLGSAIGLRLFTGMLPPEPALVAYNAHLEARPARQRAGEIIWPARLFPPAPGAA